MTMEADCDFVKVTNKTGGDKNHLDMTPDTWEKLTGIGAGGAGGVDGIGISHPLPSISICH